MTSPITPVLKIVDDIENFEADAKVAVSLLETVYGSCVSCTTKPKVKNLSPASPIKPVIKQAIFVPVSPAIISKPVSVATTTPKVA